MAILYAGLSSLTIIRKTVQYSSGCRIWEPQEESAAGCRSMKGIHCQQRTGN